MKYQLQVPISCTTCGHHSHTGRCTNPDLILPDQPQVPGRWRPPPEAKLAWQYCDGAFWTETEDE